MDKVKVSATEFYNDSVSLANEILASEYKPDVVFSLWRGGAVPGIVVDEHFTHANYTFKHFPIKTEHYRGSDRQDNVKLNWLKYDMFMGAKSVLIIDDIFDSGKSVQKIIDTLDVFSDFNLEIRVATVYYKIFNNKTHLEPDWYIESFGSNEWLVLPHEIE